MGDGRWGRLFRAVEHAAPAWLVVHVLGTVILAVVLLTGHPGPLWVWVLLGLAFVAWVAWMVFERRRPRLATALLACAAVLPAFALGESRDVTAFVVCLVILGRFASLTATPGYLVAAVWVVDVVVALLAAWLSGWSALVTFAQPVVLTGVVLLGLHPRQNLVRARQAEQLLEQTRLAQREHARAAALDERTRIAREMHDVLAHSLGALGMQLEVAEALLSEKNDPAAALDRVRRSRRLAVEGLTEAREAVAALRADVPPLTEALADLVDAHGRDHGVAATFEATGDVGVESPAVTVALLRAAREALTNAGRHAPGAAVAVNLARAGETLTMRVHNEASGESAGTGGGFGLAGMRERVALVGGTLTAGPDPAGWLVTVEVPSPGGFTDE